MLIKNATTQFIPAKAMLDHLRLMEKAHGLNLKGKDYIGNLDEILENPAKGVRLDSPQAFANHVIGVTKELDPPSYRPAINGKAGNEGVLLGDVNGNVMLVDRRGLEHMHGRHLSMGAKGRITSPQMDEFLVRTFGWPTTPEGLALNPVSHTGTYTARNVIPSDIWSDYVYSARRNGLNFRGLKERFWNTGQFKDILLAINGMEPKHPLTRESQTVVRELLKSRNLLKSISSGEGTYRNGVFRVPYSKTDAVNTIFTKGDHGNLILKTMYPESNRDFFFDYALGRSEDLRHLIPPKE